MNLRDIFLGLGWAVLGNLAFIFCYPMFVAFMTGLTDPSLGANALDSSVEAIYWGGYLMAWALIGAIVPVYWIVTGAQKE